MVTVCEVCYTTNGAEYLEVYGSDGSIIQLISLHLQCVTLEGIEKPKICTECWNLLENFHRFYSTVEELHKPSADSSSDEEGEQIGAEQSCNDPIEELSTEEREIETLSNSYESEVDVDEANEQLSTTKASFHVQNKVDQEEFIEGYGQIVCEHCGVEFGNFSRLKRHRLQQHQVHQESMKCSLCSKRFYTRSGLRLHLEQTHTSVRFRCLKCGLQFSLESALKAHMKVSHAVKDVVCGVCNKVYSKYRIKSHMQAVHSDTSYICELCGRTYRTEEILAKHREQHDPVSNQSVTMQCPICQREVRADYLNRHIKSMHTANETHDCQRCGRTFRSKHTLRAHVDRSCPSGTPHVCGVCGKLIKTAAKMMEHQVMHQERGYYTCSVCLEQFESKLQLFTHQSKVHSF